MLRKVIVVMGMVSIAICLSSCSGTSAPEEGISAKEAEAQAGEAGKAPDNLKNPSESKPDEVDAALQGK